VPAASLVCCNAIRPTAMPVILTNPDAVETWMTATWDETKGLQMPKLRC